jgi:hypothetical protein
MSKYAPILAAAVIVSGFGAYALNKGITIQIGTPQEPQVVRVQTDQEALTAKLKQIMDAYRPDALGHYPPPAELFDRHAYEKTTPEVLATKEPKRLECVATADPYAAPTIPNPPSWYNSNNTRPTEYCLDAVQNAFNLNPSPQNYEMKARVEHWASVEARMPDAWYATN